MISIDRRLLKIVDTTEVVKAISEARKKLTELKVAKRDLVVYVVADGGAYFAGKLLVSHPELEVRICKVSSYQGVSGGTISDVLPINNVFDKDVLFIDDILDSGNTCKYLTDKAYSLGARSVTSFLLIDKIQYEGAEIVRESKLGGIKESINTFLPIYAAGFLVGLGLDLEGKYRYLNQLYELRE